MPDSFAGVSPGKRCGQQPLSAMFLGCFLSITFDAPVNSHAANLEVIPLGATHYPVAAANHAGSRISVASNQVDQESVCTQSPR